MFKNSAQVVQAVPLKIGKINVGAGIYEATSLIHCETDCTLTLSDGVTEYLMVAGMDRAYQGKFTVAGGTVTYD